MKKQSRRLAVIKSIAFCGRQGIALRGHHQEVDTSGGGNRMVRKKQGADILVGDKNTGNLLSLLKFRRESGDVFVDDVINNRAKNSSAIIQNEILDIMEQTIITDIRENMLKEGPFTVIADETTDGSNQTQLSLSLRFMNEEGPPKVEERFLRFVRLDACTGEWNLTVFVYKASKTLVLDLCLVKYTENRQTNINFLI